MSLYPRDEYEEQLSPYELWERRIVCPKHGLKYRRKSKGQYGGYFCAGKMPDGSWCNWHKTQRQIDRMPIIIDSYWDALEQGCEIVYVDDEQKGNTKAARKARFGYR